MATDAKIDELIKSLKDLIKEQRRNESTLRELIEEQKVSPGTRREVEDGGSPERQRVRLREGEEIIESYKREAEALNKKLDLLEKEEQFRGRLSDQKKVQAAQMQEELKLAYIAGLFDGEGSIQYKQYMRKRTHNKKPYPTWSIRMEIASENKNEHALLKNAPHTLQMITSDKWEYPYSRVIW